jgi:hypothetical protein
MKEFALNVPINQVSFGQVSYGLLKEIFDRSINPSVFPIGEINLSTQDVSEDFHEWLRFCVDKSSRTHQRSTSTIKLWHLFDSLQSYSEKQTLLTFYELDSPTEEELNIAKNNNTIVTSKFTQGIFKERGVDVKYTPLFFDKNNFHVTKDEEGNVKRYFDDDRITFNLVGKFEKRKHHHRVIKSWIKRFGDDKKYFLQACVYNNFFSQDQNISVFQSCTEGKRYFNVNFLNYMPTNDLYNDYLNSSDIILGMSGGEGWGLPEFHSVGLGKHAVILNAHSYNDWANEGNAILVQPTEEKIDVYDDTFFKKGAPYNQGQIFDFNEDEFIHACEKAIEKVKSNKVNESGLKIQEDFPVSKTLDSILEDV